MTCLPPDALAAFLGLDWADAPHDVCLPAAGSERRECRVLVHTPEALAAWVSPSRQRFTGPPMARGLARHQGPLVSARRPSDCLVRVPVHPRTRARDRDAFAPSPAQDDPPDAALPLGLLLTPRATRTPLNPQSPALRPRAPLVDPRRRRVGDHVRLTTRLSRPLKPSFPHVLHWVHDQDTALCGAVLTHGPRARPPHSRAARPWSAWSGRTTARDADAIEPRLHALTRAMPLTAEAGVIVPTALLVPARGSQRRGPLHAIETFALTMAPPAQRPPDFPCLAA
jgi:hypothetical protein